MARARRRAEVEKLEAELAESRPYLGLAREIQDELRRLAADPDEAIESIGAAIDRLPGDARSRTALAAFHQLPAEQRWAVLARLFDDDELRAALAAEHERQRLEARLGLRHAELAREVLEQGRLDTERLAAGDRLTLGLVREADASTALAAGAGSSTCARRLVLQATEDPGVLHLLEDVFNPTGGLFVTADYDADVWQGERLPSHSLVRVGCALGGGRSFEPVLYPGGRVDVEVDPQVRPEVRVGRLHAGSALVGSHELFTGIRR